MAKPRRLNGARDKQALLIRPRTPIVKFAEQAKSDGLLPHEFLIAVMSCRHVDEIDGRKYEPTLKQRKQAAEHLAAALSGTDTQPESDDFYSPHERK